MHNTVKCLKEKIKNFAQIALNLHRKLILRQMSNILENMLLICKENANEEKSKIKKKNEEAEIVMKKLKTNILLFFEQKQEEIETEIEKILEEKKKEIINDIIAERKKLKTSVFIIW